MNIFLLFILLFAEPESKPVIVLDDNLASCLFRQDLETDWLSNTQYFDQEELRYIDYLQSDIKNSTIIIDHLDIVKLKSYRIDYKQPRYPCIKFSRYTSLVYFPEEMIHERLFGLLTYKWLFDDRYGRVDSIQEWREKCERIIDRNNRQWEVDVFNFALSRLKKNEHLKMDESIDDIDYNYYKELYSNNKDFPKLTEPDLPPKPNFELPWQNGYSFGHMNDKTIKPQKIGIRNLPQVAP